MHSKEEEYNWKVVQVKTFTKWINNKLKKKGYSEIRDIFTDLRDGIVLKDLLYILSGECISCTSRPITRIQKLENIQKILEFISSKNIKTINIGAYDVVDGNEKLTLGLIWIIILRFAISEVRVGDLPIRDALITWCRAVTAPYKEVEINDFSKSWQDGLAFNAIVHRFRPDLIGDFSKLIKRDRIENLKNVFEIAERCLDIPKLLDYEDLVCVLKPDELSVMTYVSQYYNKFSQLETEELSRKRAENFLRVFNLLTSSKNSYEKEAERVLKLKEEYLRDNNEIEELLTVILGKICQRDEKLSKMKYSYVNLSSLLDTINSINSFYKISKYLPQKEYLPESILSEILEDKKIPSDILKNIKSKLLNKDLAEYEGLVYEKCELDNIESKMFDEYLALLTMDGRIEEQCRELEGFLNTLGNIKEREKWNKLVKDKLELFCEIQLTKDNLERLINEGVVIFHKVAKTGKISEKDAISCMRILGLNVSDALHQDFNKSVKSTDGSSVRYTLDEFIVLIKKFYDQSFDVIQIKNDLKILSRGDNLLSVKDLSVNCDEISNIVIGDNGLEKIDIKRLLDSIDNK